MTSGQGMPGTHAGAIPPVAGVYVEERCGQRGCAAALLFKVRLYRDAGGGLEVQIKCARCRTITARRYPLAALLKALAIRRT